MTRRGMMTGLATAIALVGVMVTAAPAADMPDSWITAKTKIALMTSDGVDAWEVNVDTVKGDVTLHGKVESAAAKSKAETVASRIDGVKKVNNLLQVVPNRERAMTNDKDDVIKTRVEKAFAANPLVADSGISVASVNKGVVLLSGKTKDVFAELQAIEVASAVPGVRRVSSEVTTSSPATQ